MWHVFGMDFWMFATMLATILDIWGSVSVERELPLPEY